MKEYLIKIKSHYFLNGKRLDIDTTNKDKIAKLAEDREPNAFNLVCAIFTANVDVDKDDEVAPTFYSWVIDKTTEILNNLTYFSYEEVR